MRTITYLVATVFVAAFAYDCGYLRPVTCNSAVETVIAWMLMAALVLVWLTGFLILIKADNT